MSYTKKIESLTEIITDDVYDLLLPGVRYLKNKDGIGIIREDREKLNFPELGPFDTLVTTIASGLLVNILSFFISNRLLPKKKSTKKKKSNNDKEIEIMKKKVDEIYEKLSSSNPEWATDKKGGNIEITDPNTLKIKIMKLMQDNGWPKNKAEETAEMTIKEMDSIKKEGISTV